MKDVRLKKQAIPDAPSGPVEVTNAGLFDSSDSEQGKKNKRKKNKKKSQKEIPTSDGDSGSLDEILSERHTHLSIIIIAFSFLASYIPLSPPIQLRHNRMSQNCNLYHQQLTKVHNYKGELTIS